MVKEERSAFVVPLEEIPEHIREQRRKYGAAAHTGGVCPKTENSYKEIASKSMPGPAPMGAKKYCSECGIELYC